MKKYYYADKRNDVQGPLSQAEIETLLRLGIISKDTPVVEEGHEDWAPYGEVVFPETASPFPPQDQPQHELETLSTTVAVGDNPGKWQSPWRLGSPIELAARTALDFCCVNREGKANPRITLTT